MWWRREWDLNPRGLSATDLAGLSTIKVGLLPTRLPDPRLYGKVSRISRLVSILMLIIYKNVFLGIGKLYSIHSLIEF
jgi:hypothetical protein